MEKVINPGIFLLAALIIVSPLPLGCVFCWSFFLLLFLLNLASLLLLKGEAEVSDNRVEVPLFLLMGFMAFQIVPLPKFLLRLISPAGVKILSLSLGDFNFHPLSVAPSRTVFYFVGFSSFILLGLVLWRREWKREEVLFLTKSFIILGLWESLFSILKFLAHRKRVLVFWGSESTFPTGTLRNPDHFSALLEIILPISLGYIYYKMKRESLVRVLSSREVLFLLAPLSILLAIALSHSRAGVVTTGISLLIFFQLTVGRKMIPRHRRAYRIFLLSLTLSVLALGGLFTYRKGLKLYRGQIWALSLQAFKDYPVLGSGFGTFPDLIETYRREPGFLSLIAHAHNDYLEFLTEGGLLGASLLFVPLILAFFSGFQAWEDRRYPLVRCIGAGFISGVLAGAFHSFFDFPLRIPSVALAFVVAFSTATSIGRVKRRQR